MTAGEAAELAKLREDIAHLRQRVDILHAYLSGELGGDGRPGNVHRVLELVAANVAQLDKTLRGDGATMGLLTRLGKLEESAEKTAAIDKTIRGDGNTGGLVTRIDRVEHAHESQRWAIRLLAGAIVTVAIKVVFDMVLRFGSRSGSGP